MLQAVIGFDAGGTATKAAVMTLDGRVVGRGAAGPGNFHLVKEEGMRDVLAAAAAEALAQAETDVRLLGAFIGSAGATGFDEQQRIMEVAKGLNLAPLWRVTGDMVPALAAGTDAREGIVIISGTGSICWGCDAKGTQARAGGWGYLLGDEGSGFSIAQAGFVAALQAYDGRGAKTSLMNRILHHLAVEDMENVISRVYREQSPRTWLASFAPLVLEAAADGDQVANGILEDAAGQHVQAILAVYRRLEFNDDLTVVATGGLFQKTNVLYNRVRLALSQVLPNARLVVPTVDPAVGACYLARRLVSGEPWPPEVVTA